MTDISQISDLLKLAGQEKADVTASPLSQNMLILKLISEAKGRGITWAQIGSALYGKPDGRAAKYAAKKLARSTQRELIQSDVLQEGGS